MSSFLSVRVFIVFERKTMLQKMLFESIQRTTGWNATIFGVVTQKRLRCNSVSVTNIKKNYLFCRKNILSRTVVAFFTHIIYLLSVSVMWCGIAMHAYKHFMVYYITVKTIFLDKIIFHIFFPLPLALDATH